MSLPLTRFASVTLAFALACPLVLPVARVVAQTAAPVAQPMPPGAPAQLAPLPPKPAPVPNAQIKQPRPAPAPIPPPLVTPPPPKPHAALAPVPAAAPAAAAAPASAAEHATESVPPAPAPSAVTPAVPPPAPVVQQAPPPPYPPYGYPPPGADPRYGGYPAYPGYPPPGPRLSKGMLITGISILGGTYGASILLGMIVTSEGGSCSNCDDVGPPLFLPVLGPFIAAGQADGDDAILIFLGLGQLVGAGLTIGGIVKYKNSKKRAEQQGYVVELGRGRTLALDVAASPRLVGPSLQLNF